MFPEKGRKTFLWRNSFVKDGNMVEIMEDVLEIIKEIRKILSRMYILFDLLDRARLDCRKAIFSEISDFEDAVMVETVLRCGMDCIVTRNIKDYEKSLIKIYQPDEFLDIFHQEEID